MTTGPPDGKCANPAGGPGGMPLALRLNEGLGSTGQGKEEDRDIAKHAMTLLDKRAGCGVLTDFALSAAHVDARRANCLAPAARPTNQFSTVSRPSKIACRAALKT